MTILKNMRHSQSWSANLIASTCGGRKGALVAIMAVLLSLSYSYQGAMARGSKSLTIEEINAKLQKALNDEDDTITSDDLSEPQEISFPEGYTPPVISSPSSESTPIPSLPSAVDKLPPVEPVKINEQTKQGNLEPAIKSPLSSDSKNLPLPPSLPQAPSALPTPTLPLPSALSLPSDDNSKNGEKQSDKTLVKEPDNKNQQKPEIKLPEIDLNKLSLPLAPSPVGEEAEDNKQEPLSSRPELTKKDKPTEKMQLKEEVNLPDLPSLEKLTLPSKQSEVPTEDKANSQADRDIETSVKDEAPAQKSKPSTNQLPFESELDQQPEASSPKSSAEEEDDQGFVNQNQQEPTQEVEKTQSKKQKDLNKKIKERLKEEAAPAAAQSEKAKEKDNTADKPISRIDKFKQEVAKKGSKEKQPDIIKKDEFEDSEEKQTIRRQDEKEQKFISNETKLLLFPNDQIVLGKIEFDGFLETLNYWQFFPFVEKEIAYLRASPQRMKVEKYLSNYREQFTEEAYFSPQDIDRAFKEATSSIEKNNIYRLQVVLDNYPILQMADDNGNNLLHLSAYGGRYAMAKLLIMKGVNINARNNLNETSLEISQKRNFNDVSNLIINAGS